MTGLAPWSKRSRPMACCKRRFSFFFSDNGGVNWQAMNKERPGKTNDLASPFATIPPTSNHPLRGGKASIYEGGTREPCIVVWPGVVKPGGQSDALIQSIDWLPTLTEALGVPLPSALKLDGRSFLPVLKGATAKHRETLFTFFPHHTPASSQLPAVSVRRGDWKLIRFLYDGPRQEHRYELYNLHDDIGESRDLAGNQPERVKELDRLIDGFLEETQAVVPGPNPAYNSNGAASDTSSADPLLGWKARNCQANVKQGILTLSSQPKPGPIFLGNAMGKQSGPVTVRMRARAKVVGTGKVEWLPSGKPEATERHEVSFSVSDGWQELAVLVPTKGPLGIVRLYLPAEREGVEIDWIALAGEGGGRVEAMGFLMPRPGGRGCRASESGRRFGRSIDGCSSS